MAAVLFFAAAACLFVLWCMGFHAAAAALLCMPGIVLISWVLGFAVRGKLEAKVTLPSTAEKGVPFQAEITVRSKSLIPSGPILCRLCAHNMLTGETERFAVRVSVPPMGEGRGTVTLSSRFCGYVRLEIEKAEPMDWFGLLSVPGLPGGHAAVSVLPELFPTKAYVTVPPAAPEDSTDYSPYRPGSDYSETFQLREYREGDELRGIHWKLSSKMDKLIVREPGLPVARSLLVFWDKSAGNPNPEAMDVMAEVTLSLCRSLCDSGLAFHAAWNEGGRIVQEQIQDEEDFIHVLPRMLRRGAQGEESGIAALLREGHTAAYSKIILICAELPGEAEQLGLERISALTLGGTEGLCGSIPIRPESYREDLQILEFA